MKRQFALASIAVVLTMASLAHADDIDDAAAAYVGAQGFESFPDVSVLADILDMALTDTGKARKDADVTAVEKALLLLEANESFVPRTRYVARIGIAFSGDIPVSFVEVERYNLGPALWQETIDAYGAENTAPLEEFGEGPHVIWRVATQPNTTASAMLLAASRREVAGADASTRDCIGRACLSLDPIELMTEWSKAPPFDMEMPQLAYDLQPAAGEDEGDAGEEDPFEAQQSTALMALQLAAAAGLAHVGGDGVMWTAEPSEKFGPDAPFAEFVIDRNLGQDIGSEGILRVAAMDGDAGQRWLRLAASGVDDGVPPELWTAEGELTPITFGEE